MTTLVLTVLESMTCSGLRRWRDDDACFAEPDGHVVVVGRPRPA
jgi:hypothetical protein